MKHRPHGNVSFGNSREISSTQQGPHEQLVERVMKHLYQPFKKPLQEHNIQAFQQAQSWLVSQNKPLILDSCCGIGESTRRLADMFPDYAVIGVDQSADRLSRQHGELPDNGLLVRANLLDFWRLAVEEGWQPERHYLLYPNPYPKKSQFKLRWHGGPVLPFIAQLGGVFECRSNWKIYVQEMAMAYGLLKAEGLLFLSEEDVQLRLKSFADEVQAIRPDPIMTPFERKYLASGQDVFQWIFAGQGTAAD